MMARFRWSRQSSLGEVTTRTLSVGVAAVVACSLLLASSSARAQSGRYGTEGSGGFEQETYHVVQEGETLYDLAEQYFGDRQRWPKLWSYNPQITNPHWIYPGDVVYLRPPEGVRGPKVEEASNTTSGSGGSTDEGGDDSSMDINMLGDTRKGLLFDVAGMIVDDQPEFVGRIVDSPKEARMIGEYDKVWVGFGDDAYAGKQRDRIFKRNREKIRDPGKIERKMRFAIVDEVGPVEGLDGNEIGTKYYVVGTLVVTETSEEALETAYIDRSWREIERGDMLIPYERQLKRVAHVPADENIVLRIIDTLHELNHFGESQYVFLDKGASDGVRSGNRGYIYQRRSGLPKRWRKQPEIPWIRVGRVRVIEVTEQFSTAVITRSEREISIGDRVEMYEGN
jgi:hypothetical protein